MPEVARRNTIEVGEAVVRAGSKIEARDQVEQALIGAIRDRYRQRFLVKNFDVAADQRVQQPAQGPLLRSYSGPLGNGLNGKPFLRMGCHAVLPIGIGKTRCGGPGSNPHQDRRP
jgi:hypothetical protein